MEENLKNKVLLVSFGGDLTPGAGVSSSAALCNGFTRLVASLFYSKNPDFDFESPSVETGLRVCKISQQAEHIIGIKCGLLD